MFNSSFWKGRRILVSGHTGFKGSWLTLWLLSLGAEVWGVSLDPVGEPNLFRSLGFDSEIPKNLPGTLHNHILDICELSTLQEVVELANPEVVFHLAAQPLVRESYKHPLHTWAVNVQGSLHVLEALRFVKHQCAVVMITTDKVYENFEWDYGYRESDRLGGRDPYSASKAAAELAIASWRDSFCGSSQYQTPYLRIASARAGNVIGGGDWAADRIVPDAMRAVAAGQPVSVRSPQATRPWQHVLEPLSGYLILAEKLMADNESHSEAFNFGPSISANRSVQELVEKSFQYWIGTWTDCSISSNPHEAGRLHLQIDKSYHRLGWKPHWPFETTVERTVKWYKKVHEGSRPLDCCLDDLRAYEEVLKSVC